jgi:hypothetical protein
LAHGCKKAFAEGRSADCFPVTNMQGGMARFNSKPAGRVFL